MGPWVLNVKFSFSEKATKICAIVFMVLNLLSKRQNHKDDCAHFCGLLRKAELYCESLSRYYLTLKLHERNKLGLYRTKREVK